MITFKKVSNDTVSRHVLKHANYNYNKTVPRYQIQSMIMDPREALGPSNLALAIKNFERMPLTHMETMFIKAVVFYEIFFHGISFITPILIKIRKKLIVAVTGAMTLPLAHYLKDDRTRRTLLYKQFRRRVFYHEPRLAPLKDGHGNTIWQRSRQYTSIYTHEKLLKKFGFKPQQARGIRKDSQSRDRNLNIIIVKYHQKIFWTNKLLEIKYNERVLDLRYNRYRMIENTDIFGNFRRQRRTINWERSNYFIYKRTYRSRIYRCNYEEMYNKMKDEIENHHHKFKIVLNNNIYWGDNPYADNIVHYSPPEEWQHMLTINDNSNYINRIFTKFEWNTFSPNNPTREIKTEDIYIRNEYKT